MVIRFDNKDRLWWLEKISELYYNQEIRRGELIFDFSGLEVENIGPEHIAPLACLVETLSNHKVRVSIKKNSPVGDYLASDIKLSHYWKGHKNYSESTSNNVLNLWRINESEIEVHPRRVGDFFKSRFKGKDLSAVTLSLTESYYNVQDHSKCLGNAFSMISYDEESNFLNVTVCDFGVGIPTTVRSVLRNLDDCSALQKAIEDNFSIRSKSYNAGKGLGNIRSLCCEKNSYMWIVSKKAILVANANQEKVMQSSFDFPGTWIYYRIPLSLLPEEDYVEDFMW